MTASTHFRRLLLVNPLVHDFAAYDFWARPLGLLTLAGLLEMTGLEVNLLDCMDPLSPWIPAGQRPKRGGIGCGNFSRVPITRPSRLPRIDRRYCRYGLSPDQIHAALDAAPRPEAVLITSMMTYWYPGVAETVAQIKQKWPRITVILGGVYATLCTEHARSTSGADHVLPGPAEASLPVLAEILGIELPLIDPSEVLPAHHLIPGADAAPLLTSRGCPFSCPYCGVKALHPRFIHFSPERVMRELMTILQHTRARDIAIYDDALLINTAHALEILERIAALPTKLRLHAASGLSCRGLTREVARAMKRAGFFTIRLGLESADPLIQKRMGGKVTVEELSTALDNLEHAGFDRRQVGVYLMVGLPGQTLGEVQRGIEVVHALGSKVHLAEYSPVPGSPLFVEAQALSIYDLAEPLFHNPTLLPCASPDLDRAQVASLRRQLNTR